MKSNFPKEIPILNRGLWAYTYNINFIKYLTSMNEKSVQRVVCMIEHSSCSVDLLWKRKLLKKHRNCK
jgi:hypothetical protein